MRIKPIAFLFGLLIASCPQAHCQTQSQMNDKAGRTAATTKRETSKSQRLLTTKYASVPGFKNKLDESQELYSNFIRGHVASIFPMPKGQDSSYYGSVLPMCTATIEGDLWADRLMELKNWSKPQVKKELPALQAEYAKVDRQLNDIYVKVKKTIGKTHDIGPQFLKELTNAEVEWIAFRNSDSELYGMSQGSEAAKYQKMIELTKARTDQLNHWIVGEEEGDVCTGSVPTH